MTNHDEQLEFINNVDQQYKFMDENDLDRIITNDEDPDGYHVFIGTKRWMKQKINIKEYISGLLCIIIFTLNVG